ncbi:MAG TPA: polysaccharide deacetylase family protein [Candidatus Acidoferrales bacterium]|nr:polysaccharide deacetylase family protein [Candidatus Acidoferrales bacterium]
MRSPRFWVLLIAAAVLVIFLRRWVHHAQLELVPVIVPPDVAAVDVVAPPPGAIARRMLIDFHDLIAPPKPPRLAVLTFDDGPFPVTTPLLLAQLRALHVPAVFFVIGRDAQEQPGLTVRARAAGVELGNHTQTHPEMSSLDAGAQANEIAGGEHSVAALTGVHAIYFRPPHGNYNATTIDVARREGEVMTLWDVDPGDWRSVTPEQIVDNVRRHARTPAVILLHNGKLATIEALPSIVREYRDAGFEFVTLSELQRRLPLDAINDPVRIKI